MASIFEATLSTESDVWLRSSQRAFSANETTTPSTIDSISSEILEYFETHREQLPLLIFVYLLTIVWILYLILYNSRVQGLLFSYLLRRFYFKDASQIRFDSFSISFISGAIMFRNLHYTTGSYFVFVRDGCLVFRYWSRRTKKPMKRLLIKLYHMDVQVFNPIRANTIVMETTSHSHEDVHRHASKSDLNQTNTTGKPTEEEGFFDSLRSLFPAVEIRVENVSHTCALTSTFISIHRVESLSDTTRSPTACRSVSTAWITCWLVWSRPEMPQRLIWWRCFTL